MQLADLIHRLVLLLRSQQDSTELGHFCCFKQHLQVSDHFLNFNNDRAFRILALGSQTGHWVLILEGVVLL